MTVSSPEDTVQVIGGGVAGLNCAVQLHQRSIPFRLLESNDQLGGRIRTDLVDGFRLDRGFQVFQSAYPEARAALDYKALRLKRLVPGALVRRNSKWVPMVDPIRYPKSSLSTIFRAIGNLSDRGKLAKLLWDVRWTPLEKLMSSDGDQPSMELLAEDYAFSEDFLKSFLIPWLSGIFLERELSTSANFLRFVIKMLSAGPVYYPQAGIQSIPDQLAAKLPIDNIELNCPVTAVHAEGFETMDGLRTAAHVVLAVPMYQACQLTDQTVMNRGHTSTTCIYFAADRPPMAEPILMLNGEADGSVNHVFVMTNASADLAPAGKALVSVNLVGDTEYEPAAVRSQLQNWFGSDASKWAELAVYRLDQALPKQPPGFSERHPIKEWENTILCGDYCASASLQGALLSGRIAAEQIAARLAEEQLV